MSSLTLHQFTQDTVAKRLSCFATTELNPKLCLLAAHVWLPCWRFCGLPKFRTGSLLRQDGQDPDTFPFRHWANAHFALPSEFLLCKASLKEPMKFEAISIDVAPRLPLDIWGRFELLPNPLAFEIILRNEPERLKKLSKEDLSVVVADGISALHYAAALGAVDCFAVLLRRLGGSADRRLLGCCDARFPFGNRHDVLCLLVEKGCLSLAEHKAELQKILDDAALNGVERLLSLLLADFDGLSLSSAFKETCGQGRVDCCRLLIDAGAEVNMQIRDGFTALMLASSRGQTDFCRLLIKSGADVNLQTEHGTTALMLASREGRTDCCRLLIESGADVNLQTEQGKTALMVASSRGHTGCCRLLLDGGADVSAKSFDGTSTLMFASASGCKDCASFLKSYK